MLELALLIAAGISELIATAIGFDWTLTSHSYAGWQALGLVFLVGWFLAHYKPWTHT